MMMSQEYTLDLDMLLMMKILNISTMMMRKIRRTSFIIPV